VCLLVALDCLAINALVVAHAPRLSLDSLGPVALAYHDKHPRPLSIAIVIVILLLGTLLPRGGRVALLVFVGAAVANFASPVIWVQGVPDYFVFLGSDLIFNLAIGGDWASQKGIADSAFPQRLQIDYVRVWQ